MVSNKSLILLQIASDSADRSAKDENEISSDGSEIRRGFFDLDTTVQSIKVK